MVGTSLQSNICHKFKDFCKAYKDARSTLFPFRILFYVGISKEPVHSCVYFTQIHSISRKKMGTYGAMMILF